YSGNLSTRFKTNAGDLNLQYLQTDDQKYYTASYMGSLVWLGNRFDLSKYINNSFSLVRLENAPNIDVYSNGSHIGKTDKNGEIFSYNLTGYTKNSIAFDESQIGIDANIAETFHTFTPMNQRGYIVDFPIRNNQSRDVTFRFVDANQQALASGSVVRVLGIPNGKYPIASSSLVTVFGLAPQHYPIEVQTADGLCKSEFTLNADTDIGKPITLICK
ncbi:fimbria/pilus outer membrane usher protein, partial [Acinetobacter sp.]